MSYDLDELRRHEEDMLLSGDFLRPILDEFHVLEDENDLQHRRAVVRRLAAQFAAVRAPLEARIAELEVELKGAFATLDQCAGARERALREAAEVCWNGVPITLDIQASVLRKARDAILALIESPAVKP